MQLKLAMASTLTLLEDMRDAPLTFPTKNGGCHPLWILGNLLLHEGMFLHEWILDGSKPLASWESMFGRGTEPVADASAYPPFIELLAKAPEKSTRFPRPAPPPAQGIVRAESAGRAGRSPWVGL